MSDWPRVIESADGCEIDIEPLGRDVFVEIIGGASEYAAMFLTVDQCAALIAAITDAAKVVTGEKA